MDFCLACDERRDIHIAFPVAVTALTMSSFGDWVSFSITIQPRLTMYGPHIEHGGYMSDGQVSHDLDLIFIVY